ncbi:MAG: hypothetical protein EXS43_11970 [Opitutus sp.]|nr:hypothetical protein [Opitutus sp.]
MKNPLFLILFAGSVCAGQDPSSPSATATRSESRTLPPAPHQTEVLKALSVTVNACVKCHETYRQEVVDEVTWSRLTSAKP